MNVPKHSCIVMNDLFPTTHWTLVLQAAEGCPEQRNKALEALCRAYWTPLFKFILLRVGSRHDAEDLTQSLFASLLKGSFPQCTTPDQGRFRAFLLASAKNHLAKEWRKASAFKRNADLSPLDLSEEDAAVSEHAQAERIYDREWAVALVNRALNQLEVECTASGKGEEFFVLRPCLLAGADSPQRELAERLGRSAGATKILLHRLRRRFLELVERQVRQTVADPEEAQDEMRHLLHCLTQEL